MSSQEESVSDVREVVANCSSKQSCSGVASDDWLYLECSFVGFLSSDSRWSLFSRPPFALLLSVRISYLLNDALLLFSSIQPSLVMCFLHELLLISFAANACSHFPWLFPSFYDVASLDMPILVVYLLSCCLTSPLGCDS